VAAGWNCQSESISCGVMGADGTADSFWTTLRTRSGIHPSPLPPCPVPRSNPSVLPGPSQSPRLRSTLPQSHQANHEAVYPALSPPPRHHLSLHPLVPALQPSISRNPLYPRAPPHPPTRVRWCPSISSEKRPRAPLSEKGKRQSTKSERGRFSARSQAGVSRRSIDTHKASKEIVAFGEKTRCNT
jgi:hypothetical protein